MNEDYIGVLERAAWASLNKQDNIELILLKGHLILEGFLGNLLFNSTKRDYSNRSFSYKVNELSEITRHISSEADILIAELKSLNSIRNMLAHEWTFSVKSSGIEEWASDVLLRFNGGKYSKFTRRTKIIHAFSFLVRALVAIDEKL